MRTYLILKDRAARFSRDREIQALLRTIAKRDVLPAALGKSLKFSRALASRLKEYSFDLDRLREQGLKYERLDQLTTELLLGVR
jgi:xylose isomerase